MRTKNKVNHELCDYLNTLMIGRKQRWLCQQLGVSDASISNKLNGIYAFSATDLEKLSKIFNDEKILEFNVL